MFYQPVFVLRDEKLAMSKIHSQRTNKLHDSICLNILVSTSFFFVQHVGSVASTRAGGFWVLAGTLGLSVWIFRSVWVSSQPRWVLCFSTIRNLYTRLINSALDHGIDSHLDLVPFVQTQVKRKGRISLTRLIDLFYLYLRIPAKDCFPLLCQGCVNPRASSSLLFFAFKSIWCC